MPPEPFGTFGFPEAGRDLGMLWAGERDAVCALSRGLRRGRGARHNIQSAWARCWDERAVPAAAEAHRYAHLGCGTIVRLQDATC